MNHVKELVNTLLPPSPSLRQTAWQNFISAQGIFLWCSECEVRNARMQICSVPSQSWRWLLKADRARGVDGAEWDCVSGRRNMPDQPWRWGVAYSGSRWVSTWAAVRVWWIRMTELLVCSARGWVRQGKEGGQWSRFLLSFWSQCEENTDQYFERVVNIAGLLVNNSWALNPLFLLSGTWQCFNSLWAFMDQFPAVVNCFMATNPFTCG